MQRSKSTYAKEADFHMNNSVWWVPEQVEEKVYLVMDRHFFFCLLLSVLDLHWCMGFSLVVRSGVALVAMQASHRSGFSCGGVQALGYAGFGSCGSWALEHRISSCGACT